jgi:hypothetical protein
MSQWNGFGVGTESYRVGDRVQFNVSMDMVGPHVSANTEGEVVALCRDGLVLVLVGRFEWLADWYHIRPIGTQITDAMYKAIRADEDIVAGCLQWELT